MLLLIIKKDGSLIPARKTYHRAVIPFAPSSDHTGEPKQSERNLRWMRGGRKSVQKARFSHTLEKVSL